MLSKRILSTVVLVFLTILVIFSDWLSGLVVTLLIIMGLYEFFTMLEKKGISIYKYFGIGMGAIIPLSVLSRFELTKSWELLLIVLALLFLIIMQFKRRESSGTVVGISTTIFGILYVSWFLSFLIKIRFLDNGTAFLARGNNHYQINRYRRIFGRYAFWQNAAYPPDLAQKISGRRGWRSDIQRFRGPDL
ncbi:MAG: phosphatidate cytidylyltransferase [Candidatus Omnitrophota bacterium]